MLKLTLILRLIDSFNGLISGIENSLSVDNNGLNR